MDTGKQTWAKRSSWSPDRVHHPGMAVPGVHHADAAAEVDQSVPVGIGDHRSFSMHHGDRSHGRHPPGNRGSPSLQKGPAGRSWISVRSWMTGDITPLPDS